jgi:hypothetical protein
MISLVNEIRALFVPSFALTDHLARSAEVRTFDLTAHMRQRQTVNVVRSTCAKLRRPL